MSTGVRLVEINQLLWQLVFIQCAHLPLGTSDLEIKIYYLSFMRLEMLHIWNFRNKWSAIGQHIFDILQIYVLHHQCAQMGFQFVILRLNPPCKHLTLCKFYLHLSLPLFPWVLIYFLSPCQQYLEG